jgi:lipoate-protein ligase A
METGSTDPRFNLAFEEYVLTHRREGDYLLLWQNDNAIIVGRNQNTAQEINRDFVAAHGIRVVRRITGGGAVYHDLGNLNYSFLTDAGNAEELTMERFTRPVVAALRGLGLRAEASGRNDILVEGRKVSGTAQRLTGGRILHHGTLLFDSKPEMVAGALRVDPSKFASKSAKSVRSRIGNIRPFLPRDMDLPAFWAYLKTVLAGEGFVSSALTEAELAGVARLRAEKYDTWEWNFGRSPAFDLTNRRRFPGGLLEAGVSVKDGRIRAVRFWGDFLGVRDLAPLEQALTGTLYREEDVARVLRRQNLGELFGTITEEEILRTLFGA